MKVLLRRVLPTALLLRARQFYSLPLELGDAVRGMRDPLRPPRWLHFVGGGDFDMVGSRFLGHFRELAGLQWDEDVLDVGCGVGRMALPLAGYLDRSGSYCGFDIVRAGVRWCQRHITPYYPNFQFAHADIFNAEYNPGGQQSAHTYSFPYIDASFDFVLLTSVFTHMLPDDVAHYLREIQRVLRPNGRCLMTCFILNDESRTLMTNPRSMFHFLSTDAGYATTTPERPEAAVAYDEHDLRVLIGSTGLIIQEPIFYGEWSGRVGAREGQDIIILRKAKG